MIDVEVESEMPALARSMRRWSTLVQGELLRRTAKLTLDQAKRRFSTRRSPDGTNWAPRKGPPKHPPLRKTGAMFRALRTLGRPSEWHSGLWEGSDVARYAKHHQRGTRKMPARQFIGVGERDKAMIESAIDSFVRMRFNR